MKRLRRVVRYFLGTRSSQLVLPKPSSQGKTMRIHAYSDSDYASDVQTRRSISCAAVYVNEGLAHIHARKQTVVSTSSAEAELYACCSTLQEALFLKSLCMELKLPTELVLFSDSSAARSILSRVGLSKCKHIDIRFLWCQELIESKVVQLRRVATESNLADIGTKRLSSSRLRMLSIVCGMRF
eukprot:6466019-Amphidinium_carterae.1